MNHFVNGVIIMTIIFSKMLNTSKYFDISGGGHHLIWPDEDLSVEADRGCDPGRACPAQHLRPCDAPQHQVQLRGGLQKVLWLRHRVTQVWSWLVDRYVLINLINPLQHVISSHLVLKIKMVSWCPTQILWETCFHLCPTQGQFAYQLYLHSKSFDTHSLLRKPSFCLMSWYSACRGCIASPSTWTCPSTPAYLRRSPQLRWERSTKELIDINI